MSDQEECELCEGTGEVSVLFCDNGSTEDIPCPDCTGRIYTTLLEAEIERLREALRQVVAAKDFTAPEKAHRIAAAALEENNT